MRKLQRKLEAEIKDIRLLIFDVDGVLTDNRMIYISDHQEAKSFSAADGFAIKAVNSLRDQAPLQFAVISARHSDLTLARCEELGIRDVHQKWNKMKVLDDLTTKHGLKKSQVCYLGNDIPDLLVMEQVGLAICTADSEPELLDVSHYQTERNGGKGCCRETISFILNARGLNLIEIYRHGLGNVREGP